MEQLREEAGVTEREGRRAGGGGWGGMGRPMDEDDGCKATLANTGHRFFVYQSCV